MLDPHMDAQALYRLASDPSLLSPSIIEEIARHPAAWPALSSWARFVATPGVEAGSVPPPAPPKVPEPREDEDSIEALFAPTPEPAATPEPRRWLRKAPTPLDSVTPADKKHKKEKKVQGRRRRWPLFVAGAIALVILGAGAAWTALSHEAPEQPATASISAPPTPAAPAATPVVSASGSGFTCQATSEGVKCLGQNTRGQLGTSEAVHAHTIALGSQATYLVAGADFACASAGMGVTCWGDNRWKQAGDSDQAQLPPTPLVALEGKRITSLAAGEAFACATSDDGQITCWGTDFHGEVTGAGVQGEKAHSPAQVPLPDGAKARGVLTSRFSTCAISESGEVYCWGSNTDRRITDVAADIVGITKVG